MENAYQCAAGADALVIATEWNEFRRLDAKRLLETMRRPVLVDLRNIYEPEAMRKLGFTYHGVGRGEAGKV
jgi:UDPglucose 6-dehydrogenase